LHGDLLRQPKRRRELFDGHLCRKRGLYNFYFYRNHRHGGRLQRNQQPEHAHDCQGRQRQRDDDSNPDWQLQRNRDAELPIHAFERELQL